MNLARLTPAMTQLLAVPAREIQRRIAKDKKRKAKSKANEHGASAILVRPLVTS